MITLEFIKVVLGKIENTGLTQLNVVISHKIWQQTTSDLDVQCLELVQNQKEKIRLEINFIIFNK